MLNHEYQTASSGNGNSVAVKLSSDDDYVVLVDTDYPVLQVYIRPASWEDFIAAVKQGSFDLPEKG